MEDGRPSLAHNANLFGTVVYVNLGAGVRKEGTRESGQWSRTGRRNRSSIIVGAAPSRSIIGSRRRISSSFSTEKPAT